MHNKPNILLALPFLVMHCCVYFHDTIIILANIALFNIFIGCLHWIFRALELSGLSFLQYNLKVTSSFNYLFNLRLKQRRQFLGMIKTS